MTQASEPADVAAFVAERPAHIGAIVRRLRRRILAIAPEAVETVIPADNMIRYGSGSSRGDAALYLAAVGDKWVRLGFFFGSELPDPTGIVEGEGARLRHVKVRTPDEADAPALEALIRQGWTDGTGELTAIAARRRPKAGSARPKRA